MTCRLACYWLGLALALAASGCGSAPVTADGTADRTAETAEATAGGRDGGPSEKLPGADAPPRGEAGPATSGCIVDNSAAALAERDGFYQACANPVTDPGAVCGDGAPYKFSYRPAQGQSQGLLLYFKGGGNCTDYISCWGKDGKGGEGRRVSTMENTKNTEPSVLSVGGNKRTYGFFDRVEPSSPFRAYDVVFIAYCTGDGGLGTPHEVDLARPAEALPSAPAVIHTYFRGVDNIKLAVDFARKTFASPARLAIVGSSAGAYASMHAVPTILDSYGNPSIPIHYYGEGGLGVGHPSFIAEGDSIVATYNGTHGKPLVRFTQFTHISDATQIDYAPAPYNTASAFQPAARAIVEQRAAARPSNYRYFASNGSCHTVAGSPALYQQFEKSGTGWKPKSPAVKPNPDLTLQGVNLVAWINTLVKGSGTVSSELQSLAGDWTTVSTICNLPGSGPGSD